MNFVKYEQDEMIGIITINRSEALNALNSSVLDEIGDCFDNIDINAVRAVVLTGEGIKSFVAGADIGEMSKLSKT